MNSRWIQGAGAIAFLALVCLACSPATATDSWNEAVTLRNGKRVVELPPKGGAFPETAPAQWEPPVPHHTYIIEGPHGLVECVQPYLLPTKTCIGYRPGIYTKKRQRAWVLKRKGRWTVCPDPKAVIGCTGLYTAEYPPFKLQD